MNRLDPVSGMLVSRSENGSSPEILRTITWGILTMVLVLALLMGNHLAHNFTDRAIRFLSEASLTVLLVDFWALGIRLFRKTGRTPLRIPTRTPLIFIFLHLALWYWSRHLISFEVLYRLEPMEELAGVYVVRWGIVLLLVVLSCISVATSIFQTRLVGWVLISETTAVPEISQVRDPGSEPDMPAGPEHVYEAQVILNNLGYAIGGIDGKVSESTSKALGEFQESCGLDPSGELTILTMIELRNRWAGEAFPPPGQSVKALPGHVVRRLTNRVVALWEKRRDS